MPDYTMNFSDSLAKAPFIISPLSIDALTTSLTLYGQGYLDYGEGLQENLIQLLENFASGTAPANPTVGQFWYDTTNNVVKVFDNAQWNLVSDLGLPGSSTRGFKHDQTTPSATWLITHNLNTEYIQTTVYIDDGFGSWSQMIPQDVIIIDMNTLRINFTNVQQGRALAIGVV